MQDEWLKVRVQKRVVKVREPCSQPVPLSLHHFLCFHNFSCSKHISSFSRNSPFAFVNAKGGFNQSFTIGLEDAQDLVAGNDADLSDAVRVTQNDTNLGGSGTLLGQLANLLNDLVGGGLEPRGNSARVGNGRGRNALAVAVKTTHVFRCERGMLSCGERLWVVVRVKMLMRSSSGIIDAPGIRSCNFCQQFQLG